jgi:regulator of replication initiation timing
MGSSMPDRDQIFEDLRKVTQQLNALMEKNPDLTIIDQVILENNIHMLQLIYTAWKSRHLQRVVDE